MTQQDAEDGIYKLSEQMSAEIEAARLQYENEIAEIWRRYHPMLEHLTKHCPHQYETETDFRVKFRKQKASAA